MSAGRVEQEPNDSIANANYGVKILKSDFEAGFLARSGLKDLGLAVAAGRASGRSLPQLEALHARMAEAVVSGSFRPWPVPYCP